MPKEYRNAEIVEFRTNEDGSHSAELQIVTYNVGDTYNTSFDMHTFEDTVRSGQIPAMWAHEHNRPIGVVRNLRNTEQHLRGRLDFLDFSKVPDAAMAHEAMHEGAMPGISFAFERVPGTDRPDPELRGVTRVGKAVMHEVSSVLINSVPGSLVLSVRAVDTEESMLRSAAADILIKFQQGKLDLADALQSIKAGVIASVEDKTEDDKEEEVVEEIVEPTAEEIAAKEAAEAAEQAKLKAEDDALLAQLDTLAKGL